MFAFPETLLTASPYSQSTPSEVQLVLRGREDPYKTTITSIQDKLTLAKLISPEKYVDTLNAIGDDILNVLGTISDYTLIMNPSNKD
jgi:hypothetical protein